MPLFANGDGTYMGGAFDVLLILHNVSADTYHPALFVEAPLPGPFQMVSQVEIVRLKSNMHYTKGAPTLEQAQVLFDELAAKIRLPDTNLWRDRVTEWDGEQGIVLMFPNWLREEQAV